LQKWPVRYEALTKALREKGGRRRWKELAPDLAHKWPSFILVVINFRIMIPQLVNYIPISVLTYL
jgi:hypothetical protein